MTSSLPTDWCSTARPATPEEIAAIPADRFLDREGDVRGPFGRGEVTLAYLAVDHPAMQLAMHGTDRTGCLKQPTSALLIAGDTVIGQGSNAGRKWPFCMRMRVGARTGEGYEHCRNVETCHQIEHAEVMAIHDAVFRIDETMGDRFLRAIEGVNTAVYGRHIDDLPSVYAERNRVLADIDHTTLRADSGLDLVLYGHWWCCQSCLSAMIDAGVRRVYLIEDARAKFDPTQPENILPKFQSDGFPIA